MRLTAPQAKKLMKGGVIQLKPAALKDNAHYLILEKKTANKVRRAQRAGTGCRIQLSPQEMHHSGEGIMDFFNKIKEGAQWVKNKIIDTPFYQQNIRPTAKNLVNQGIDTFVPAPGREIARKASDFVGEQTGAFGIREDFQRFGKKAKDFYQQHAKKYVAPHLRKAVQGAEQALVSKAKQYAPQYATDIDKLHNEYGERAVNELGSRTGAFGLRKGRGLQNDYSNFLNPMHPAMRPVAPNLPAIGGWVYMYPVQQGGSFKVAGARGGKRGFGKQGGSFRTN